MGKLLIRGNNLVLLNNGAVLASPDAPPPGDAPSAPTGLAASLITDTTMTVSWGATSDTDNYNVYVNSVLVASPTGTSHPLTGLSSWTIYNIHVTAENAFGESGPSATISPRTTDSTAPTAPVIAFHDKSHNYIDIAITNFGSDPHSGVAEINVYVDSMLAGSTGSSPYRISGLDPSTLYSIFARAENAAGLESANSNTLSITTDAAPSLGDPTGLSASATAAGQTTLSWTAAAGATGYRIYREFRGTGRDMYGYHYHKTVAGTSSVITGLGSNLPWRFKVSAINSTDESGFSNEVNVTTSVASNVYTTEFTAYGGDGPFTANHSFANNIGRANPNAGTQRQAVHIWHDAMQTTPIVFNGCTFTSKDFGLFSDLEGANVEIKNCIFLFDNPNISGGTEGKVIHIWRARRFIFQNNIIFGGRGVWVNETFASTGTDYLVENNMFFDIHGLRSNGAGGWTNEIDPNYENSQACMMVGVPAGRTCRVRYNYVFSRPRQSKIEDAFSIFETNGTSGARKEWSYNCVNGRYDRRDLQVNEGSGTAFQVESASSYIDLHHNTIVSCGGNPMSTSWASNVRWYDNRLVSRPYVPGEPGVPIGFHWRGHQIGNEFWEPVTPPVTNSIGHDNLIWYPRWNSSSSSVEYVYSLMMYLRPDALANGCSEFDNDVRNFAPAPTHEQEQAEVALWWDYIKDNSLVVGSGV